MRSRRHRARLCAALVAAVSASSCTPAPSSPAATGAPTTAIASPGDANSPRPSPQATIVVPSDTIIAHRAGQAPTAFVGPAPTVRLLGAGVDAGEPTIGLLADGRIAFQGWDRPTGVEAGTATISVIDPVTGAASLVLEAGALRSHDPYLWVDPTTDRMFTANLQVPGELDATSFCTVIRLSDDAGATWRDSARRCKPTPEDRPRVITARPVSSKPDSYPNLVYLCFQDDEGGRGHLCAVSVDGGRSFDAPAAEAFAFDDLCNSSFGHPAVGPDGSLWLVTAGCRHVKVAVSHDEARTWQVFEPGGPETNGEGESGIALDSDGVVYVVWTAVDRLPRLVISTDRGASWGESMNVAAPGVKEANIATLAVGGPGQVAIGYVGSMDAPGGPQDPGSNACLYQPCPDLDAWAHATWHAWLTVSETALDVQPLFLSAVLNDPASPVVRGNCGPGRCKSIVDFLDVAIDPKGRPMLAFVACPEGICPTTPLRGAWASVPGFVGILEGIDLR